MDSPSATWLGPNLEPDAPALRIGRTSLVTPSSVLQVGLADRRETLLKQEPVLGDFDPARYTTSREWADAPDGTRVPISVVHRRGLDLPAPTVLYGYGAYEISIDPSFSHHRLSLLDRGAVFAIAHVRGGGEMGRAWYEDGRMEHKANTFSDFIASARHLVDAGMARPGALAGRGGSAGGLLIGAVANQAPELFRALVAHVPFVDCVTTMLDDELPLTVGEWEEWGNPLADESAYWRMLGYSPYDNVTGENRTGPSALSRPVRDRRPERPPRRPTGSRRSGSPSCGPSRPRPGCCCAPSWARATVGRPDATTPGRRRHSCLPSSSTRWAWPAQPSRAARRPRRVEAQREGRLVAGRQRHGGAVDGRREVPRRTGNHRHRPGGGDGVRLAREQRGGEEHRARRGVRRVDPALRSGGGEGQRVAGGGHVVRRRVRGGGRGRRDGRGRDRGGRRCGMARVVRVRGDAVAVARPCHGGAGNSSGCP